MWAVAILAHNALGRKHMKEDGSNFAVEILDSGKIQLFMMIDHIVSTIRGLRGRLRQPSFTIPCLDQIPRVGKSFSRTLEMSHAGYHSNFVCFSWVPVCYTNNHVIVYASIDTSSTISARNVQIFLSRFVQRCRTIDWGIYNGMTGGRDPIVVKYCQEPNGNQIEFVIPASRRSY